MQQNKIQNTKNKSERFDSVALFVKILNPKSKACKFPGSFTKLKDIPSKSPTNLFLMIPLQSSCSREKSKKAMRTLYPRTFCLFSLITSWSKETTPSFLILLIPRSCSDRQPRILTKISLTSSDSTFLQTFTDSSIALFMIRSSLQSGL